MGEAVVTRSGDDAHAGCVRSWREDEGLSMWCCHSFRFLVLIPSSRAGRRPNPSDPRVPECSVPQPLLLSYLLDNLSMVLDQHLIPGPSRPLRISRSAFHVGKLVDTSATDSQALQLFSLLKLYHVTSLTQDAHWTLMGGAAGEFCQLIFSPGGVAQQTAC